MSMSRKERLPTWSTRREVTAFFSRLCLPHTILRCMDVRCCMGRHCSLSAPLRYRNSMLGHKFLLALISSHVGAVKNFRSSIISFREGRLVLHNLPGHEKETSTF